jgi:hypothetical protein
VKVENVADDAIQREVEGGDHRVPFQPDHRGQQPPVDPAAQDRGRRRDLPGRVVQRLPASPPGLHMSATGETISFRQDIKPLFRELDRDSMSSKFDLWSYDDVARWSDAILARLRDGSMPCDGAWSEEQVARIEEWVAAGNCLDVEPRGPRGPRPMFRLVRPRCPTGHADRRGILASTATKHRRSS